LRQHNCW